MTGVGATTACKRCGRAALGSDGNPDARIMRRGRDGVCIDCATVVFLQPLDNMHGRNATNLLPPGHTWAEALKLPHVREQFAVLMRAGNADANIDEIDWERVAALWDLSPPEEGMLY